MYYIVVCLKYSTHSIHRGGGVKPPVPLSKKLFFSKGKIGRKNMNH